MERTTLPGIGVRYDLLTETGRLVGVVNHRNGRRELVIFDRDDPDSCAASIVLTDEEAAGLADVLGASVMLGQLVGIGDQAEGLVTEQLPITPSSPYSGRPLGHTHARTRTGVSIVAVVRERQVITSPGPDFVFEGGDKVVVVGTRDGLDKLTAILADEDTGTLDG